MPGRIRHSLSPAGARGDGVPDDEEIGALEEALWRLHSAPEGIDAIIAIGFGVGGLRLYDPRARSLRFSPSSRENSTRLRALATSQALRLRDVRARLGGERAILRRHQLTHSLVPLTALHDLACYVLVHHRHGHVIPDG
jgi:hypothetical protein